MPNESTTNSLITRAIDHLLARPLPESTYRIQLHKDFTFQHATQIIPYLADLGITHLYCSPYLKAAPGSTHGYDVVDHCQLNPELGTQADYDALIAALDQHGMSHVLDTVPNHAGVATNENTWWNEVLEDGENSPYAHHFDIAWHGSADRLLDGKVLIPSLGDTFGNVLEKGELKLVFDAGKFFVTYYARRFPISPKTYAAIFSQSVTGELKTALAKLSTLPDAVNDSSAARNRRDEKVRLQTSLAKFAEQPTVRQVIDAELVTINGKPGDAKSFDRLATLLANQNYRLACWKTAPDEINYRRFFDVNDLAGLRQELLPVFEETHALTLGLVAEGKVGALRIDHPDGVYDPAQYLRRLQTYAVLAVAERLAKQDGLDWATLRHAALEAAEKAIAARGMDRPPLYVSVEKILAMDEAMPADWLTAGTSGYDFLIKTNAAFVDRSAEDAFSRLYQDFTGEKTSFADLIYEKKKLILRMALASELQMLAREAEQLAQRDRHSRDYTLRTLRETLGEIIACFPVYRSYVTEAGATAIDEQRISDAISAAKKRNPIADPTVFDFIRDTLLLKCGDRFNDEDRAAQRHFAGKFQQLTSPTTAKGIEDTAFYIYNRLLSLNEVGGEPSTFGISADELHTYYTDRATHWPYAQSTLSTHDTKRSEGVRARLNVLPEIADEWQAAVQRWDHLTAPLRTEIDGQRTPSCNDVYAIYQTLVGAWPLSPASRADIDAFNKRVHAYIVKADREAKQHTLWTAPNEPFEKAIAAFLDGVFDENKSADFLADLRKLVAKVSHLGLINSLSQTVLKLAAPGVADTYQGTELWDFSLVDPDNRRPVDYDKRRELLASARTAAVSDLINNLPDGRVKLFVHDRLLHLRKNNPGLLTAGAYQPIKITGTLAEHVFAFARSLGDRTVIVAVPRFVAKLIEPGGLPMGNVWDDTELTLPVGKKPITSVFTGRTIHADRVRAGDLFADFPVAVFTT